MMTIKIYFILIHHCIPYELMTSYSIITFSTADELHLNSADKIY